jgi:basic amino acid/polyamine antiporter, APA family
MLQATSAEAAAPPPRPAGYQPRLGLFSATMLVVGGIIGSGIFLNPAIVAQRVPSPGLTLAVWGLGGGIALIGAWVFAELGGRRPLSGGGYVYLREAYGRLPAFLYGWTLLLVIATGAIAAVAVTFATYTTSALGWSPGIRTPLAIGAIVVLSLVNCVGVKPGATTQSLFTLLKLGALAGLIIAGMSRVGPAQASEPLPQLSGAHLVLAVGAGLVPVLFAFGGWQQTNFVAEELVDARRTLPRALLIGVMLVVAVYLLANVAYLRTLGIAGLAGSNAPAADTMGLLLGPRGAVLIAAGIAASTFGFLSLVILVTPRVYRAMAADGLFFPRLARLHPRYGTPVAAILVQGGWAVFLALTGTYGALLDYVVFGDWIFFGLTASTLFYFRRLDQRAGAEWTDGFRMPAYPAGPIIFILAAAYVVLGSMASNPGNALKGSGLIALGVPAFWFWEKQARRSPLLPPPGTPPGTSGSARRSRRSPADR